MLYSLDKLKAMVKDDEVLHIRLSSWDNNCWARLDHTGRATHMGEPIALWPGAYKIAEDLPMTARIFKKLFGPDAMLEDGIPVTIKSGSTRADPWSWRDTAGRLRSELVQKRCDVMRQRHLDKQLRADRKRQWILNADLELTTGFELETQETEGMTKDTLDTDKARLKECKLTEIKDMLKVHSKDRTALSLARLELDKLQQVLDILGVGSLNVDWPLKYYMPFDSDLLEVGTDGSVEGFEIRTIGGLSEEKFREAAQAAFSAQHEINNRCSFHIHVGMPDKSSLNSVAAMGTMISSVLLSPDLPEGVRERFADERANYFLKPNLTGHAKDSFIRVHPQGTLEFRCFGNVQSVEEAMKCREIAIEAVRAGLCCTDKDEDFDNMMWKAQVKQLMEQGLREERHEDCAV